MTVLWLVRLGYTYLHTSIPEKDKYHYTQASAQYLDNR